MFATLLGALPPPPLVEHRGRPAAAVDAVVAAVVEAQLEAGLEPVTDGRRRAAGVAGPLVAVEGLRELASGRIVVASTPAWRGAMAVAGWRYAAGLTTSPVKQALPGPYSLARRVSRAGTASRQPLALAFAGVLRREVEALADAGCPIIEIEETDAHRIGIDPRERAAFRAAHEALTERLDGVHLSLSLSGPSADVAGAETILAGRYSSVAVDLIRGPDNWRLLRLVPGERGVIVGAMSAAIPAEEGPELILWAAAYAASMNGRSMSRVGLGTAGDLARIPWPDAVRKLGRLGDAADIVRTGGPEAIRRLDPRSVDIRSAALGRVEPRPPRRRRP